MIPLLKFLPFVLSDISHLNDVIDGYLMLVLLLMLSGVPSYLMATLRNRSLLICFGTICGIYSATSVTIDW